MPPKKIELSTDQKAIVLNFWNNQDDPPSIQELVDKVFPGQGLDGRSKEGKAISSYLREMGLEPKVSNKYYKKKPVELTDDQKAFVANHWATMTPLEIAKILFNNQNLTNLDLETIAVRDQKEYIDPRMKTLPTNEEEEDGSDISREYRSPKTIHSAILKINKNVTPGYDKDKLRPSDKRCVEALIGYMNTYRFTYQINTYVSSEDRRLFESTFIRYCYDKYDLTQEEVDQYITLTTEVVIASNIQTEIQRLQELLHGEMDEQEGRTMTMNIMRQISISRGEYNDCVSRQQKLLGDLKKKRSERLDDLKNNKLSLINIIELVKDEEGRKDLKKLADMKNQVVRDEIDRINSMEDFKIRIFGLSEEEAMYG